MPIDVTSIKDQEVVLWDHSVTHLGGLILGHYG